MRLVLLILAFTFAFAPPAEAAKKYRVAKKRKRRKNTADQVVVRYATQERAYFAVGAADGVNPKSPLGAECRTADHYATCDRGAHRAGQSVTFKRKAPVKPQMPRPQAPPSAKLIAKAARLLAAAEQTSVEFSGESKLSGVASAGVSHRVWDSLGEARVSWQQAGITMTLRNAPLFGEAVRLNADLVGWQWLNRASTVRYRPDIETQLYVFGLDATYTDERVVASVGRFIPRHAPGVLLLDGVQLGLRDTLGFDEVGVYGGGYPDLIEAERAARRWTGGAYYRIRLGDRVRVEHEARLALLQTRFETLYTEAQPRVRIVVPDAVDVTGELRFGLDGGTIDAGRASLWFPVGEQVQVTGNYRYYSARAVEIDAIGPRASLPGQTQHADAAVAWRLSSWLVGRATSWYAYDQQSDRQRLMIGPELELPTAFGGAGNLSLGYREEMGWLDGRTLYVQAMAEPARRLSVIGRVSYFADVLDRDLGAETFEELGLYGNVRWLIGPRLNLELSFLSRAGLNSVLDRGIDEDRFGLMTRFALTGRL
ncbi:MAG: hypothetical protein AAFX94_02440 [Myxococcota bacterium]